MSWLCAAVVVLAPQQDPQAEAAATASAHIEWQRSLDDALVVQKATGKPLLICVNADGETFCERFAGTTYVDPGFIATTRGYVCVVASPDRHTETDYDSLGRRVECPRFPGCTCSEHANIEPELFRRWFGGERYAPRHVAVGTDGKVLFDRYLDRSMQTAIDAIAQHAGNKTEKAVPTDAAALLRLRSAASRRAVEALYLAADQGGRLQVLRQCAAATNAPFDLLRLGLRDDDAAVFAAAAGALTQVADAEALIDLQDALARCFDPKLERDLLGAVTRLAKPDTAAARYLAYRSAALAADAAGAALAADTGPAADATAPREREAIEADLDAAEARLKKQPTDRAARLQHAQSTLELALRLLPDGDSTVPLLLEDARRSAERAEKGGDAAARDTASAIAAVALWQLGRDAEAAPRAERLIAAGREPRAFLAPQPWLRAELLRDCGRASAAAAYRAATDKPEATDTAATATAAFAYALLLAQPNALATDAAAAADLLAFAGARRAAQDVLLAAVRRWPWDRDLHDAARRRLLADRGAAALRAEYARLVDDVDQADRATAEWFAGYAAIVAAETCARDQRMDAALAAYTDSIDRFASSAGQNADFADSANHFAVLALAGRALLRHQGGSAAAAVDDLLRARALRPASMTETDGLGRKPEAILQRIARELRQRGAEAEAARLQ